MGRQKKPPLDERKLQGMKYFKLLDDLLRGLRNAGTDRDRAGNRELFYDQYATLLISFFFNPTIDSLRGLREFTTLEKVQKRWGIKPTSLGSLSEAARVFDPALMESIIAELAQRAGHQHARRGTGGFPSATEAQLAGLIAIDGSLLKALPKMTWALWQDERHRAIKMHVAFSVFPNAPVNVSVTHGNGSERDELRAFVKPGGFYVADRGYANNAMFREFDEQGVRFLIRVQENTTYEVERENPITNADKKAGVVRDVLVRRLGTEKHNPRLIKPLRIVQIQGDEPGHAWTLATNARELSGELVAIAYRHRWQVELFFRWFKCILGCRRLISESASGVTFQIYAAIIASLIIGLWTGTKPTKRGFEMIRHYLNGWATWEELNTFLEKQRNKSPPSKS